MVEKVSKKLKASKPVANKKSVSKKVVKDVKPLKKTNTVKISSKKSKIAFAVITVALLFALAFGIISFFPCYKREKFAIVTRKGTEKVILKLEVADTDEERLKGLMNREVLNENTGMLFDFVEPDYYSMWMKNTLIPLDMIFFNKDGRVIKTASDRVPMTEDLINPCSIEFEHKIKSSKNKPVDVDAFFEKCETKYLKPKNLVRYVIEVPAGTVKASKIRVGDILLKK
ncbi:MAG: DUF192 domain-containing protein [Alphaproteobacteria bacterium]|nr:DUF192 domain-containing protein [Alphaproteobacteria bacterium]